MHATTESPFLSPHLNGHLPSGRRAPRVAMVTTYPPSRCGIARFSHSLNRALARIGAPAEVLRIVRPGDQAAHPSSGVVMEFDPDADISVDLVRRRLRNFDAVVVQHDFGLYGRDDGAMVERLVENADLPVITVLHTVVADPSPSQRRIIASLARHSSTLVAPSQSAADALAVRYGLDPRLFSVIPHGCGWQAAPPNRSPRRRLLSWGLLGPGKGIERAVEAVSHLRDLEPQPLYHVAGQLHPLVMRSSGRCYRSMVEELVESLDVVDLVDFDARYQTEDGLRSVVADADVVVIPYDNREQVCSGVLTEALAAGRPVVATDFPHARELLSGGAGFLVDHDDIHQMAAAIRLLLVDDDIYESAVNAARRVAAPLGWDVVAGRYAQLLAGTRAHAAVG